MRKIVFFIVLLTACFTNAIAEDDCILLSQGGTGFTGQTWFYSGSGNSLQADEIKEKWNDGYRITAGSYTSKGWFVVMSKGSGIGMQTYHYASDWPTDWLKEKRNDGYALTTVSYGGGKWFIVMSQGTGISDQTWKYDTKSEVMTFIEESWNSDYRITSATAFKDKWLVVMSANSGIGAQRYCFCNGYDSFSAEVKKQWDEDYVATVVCTDSNSKFFVVTSCFNGKSSPTQSYSVDSATPKDWIKSQWDKDRYISFVGGSGVPANTSSGSNYYADDSNQNNENTWRVDAPGGNGYTEYTRLSDGRTFVKTVQTCFFCHGTAICSVCHGSGGTYNGYTGIYYPCNGCLQSGKCKYCSGTGTQIMTSYINSNGSGVGIANDGLPPVYTSPGGSYGGYGGGYGGSDYNSGSNNSRYGTYDCPTCHGTGVCQTCGGDGIADSYYTGGSMECPNCRSNRGRCSVCGGSGKKYGVK